MDHQSTPNMNTAQAVISLLAAGARTAAQQMRERREISAERDPVRQADRRAQRDAKILGHSRQWRAVFEDGWSDQADLESTVRFWAQAVPYIEDSAEAETVLAICEERLREIHPPAMRRYARLCRAGLHPADAMAGAAPGFGGDSAARSVPDPSAADHDALAWAYRQDGPTAQMIADIAAEWRGEEMAQRMQEAAGRRDTAPFDAADLRNALRRNTSLSDEAIDRIVARHTADPGSLGFGEGATDQQGSARVGEHNAVLPPGEGVRRPIAERGADTVAHDRMAAAAARAASPATLVAEDFPHSIGHAVSHMRRFGPRGPAPVTRPTHKTEQRDRGMT